MKIFTLGSFFLITVSGLAQGTLVSQDFDTYPGPVVRFQADLYSVPLAPPVSPGGTLWFHLQGNTFNGFGEFLINSEPTYVHIHDRHGGIIFSDGISNIFSEEGDTFKTVIVNWDRIGITDAQVDELYRGEWNVNIGTADFPEGAIRGQLLVPEPGGLAIFLLGLALLGRHVFWKVTCEVGRLRRSLSTH